MINLLPSFQKEELEKREKITFALHIGISVLASLVSFLLLLSGIYFYFLGELKDRQAILEAKLKYLNSEAEKEILAKNRFLSKILSFESERKEFCPVLEKIFQLLPEGIRLDSISVSKEDTGKIQISLTGFSQDREKLISLREILQRNFSEVSFPTQVWLKEKDIDFSVSFKTK